MTAQTIERYPAAPTAQGKLWEVKVGAAAGQFLSTPRKTAERIAGIAERRMAQGRPIIFTVLRLDEHDRPEWDASDEVASVLADTGWPVSGCAEQRAQVVDLLEAILVED